MLHNKNVYYNLKAYKNLSLHNMDEQSCLQSTTIMQWLENEDSLSTVLYQVIPTTYLDYRIINQSEHNSCVMSFIW